MDSIIWSGISGSQHQKGNRSETRDRARPGVMRREVTPLAMFFMSVCVGRDRGDHYIKVER